MAKMLNVVGKDKNHAIELLNAKGFETVRTITVESDKPAGTVVYQSETADEEIDVTTEILLEISEGPQETTAPPTTQPPVQETEPTETVEVSTSTKSISFMLPVRDTSYTVMVCRDGAPITGQITIEPGTDVFSLGEVQGSGTVVFDLMIDGAVYSSQRVEF